MPATALQQIIIERIKREGALTFADYMRMALYEPGYGYYVSGVTRIGWEGDYYTSTDLTSLFAHCVGRQLRQMWEEVGQPERFSVLEQGAGRGNLAIGVHAWAEQEDARFASALSYQTEDIASSQDALRSPDSQGEREDGATAAMSEIVTEALVAPDVLLSNELVDAFPVYIVEKRGDTLYEVYVTVSAEQPERLIEILQEPSSQAVAAYLDSYTIPWRSYEDGWRAEINLDALRWVERCGQILASSKEGKKSSFLLTIDYGDSADKLYTAQRQFGTLACYFRHQLTDQPLIRPGQQDITAHVNFTALIEAGRTYGFTQQLFTTQREWLNELGIEEELERIRRRDFAILDTARGSDEGQVALFKWYNLRNSVQALTARGGMGDFKVLILKKEIE